MRALLYPMTNGVLVILLGDSTKLFDKFVAFDKTYRATLRLGLKTTTADIMGTTLLESSFEGIDGAWSRSFYTIYRRDRKKPPMVSAVKHQGERLHKIARQGIEVERTARHVRIDELKLLKMPSAGCGIYNELFKGHVCAAISRGCWRGFRLWGAYFTNRAHQGWSI